MKILFSILLNASIFYVIQLLLNTEGQNDQVVVGKLWWQTYLMAGVILGVLNVTIKPILQILGIPISLFMHSLVTLVINIILLWLFDKIINDVLVIKDIGYEIIGTMNFVIAVAIFTIMNMVYSILFNKK